MKNMGHRMFHYDTPSMAYITNIYPLDKKRRLYVDAKALDNRGLATKAMVMTPPGFTAHLRLGMTVQLHYCNGNPQYPMVVLHSYNSEASDTEYHDPLPAGFSQIDDVIMHHDGIGAFVRMRNTKSTDQAFGADGSPGKIDIETASGAHISITDHAPPAPPDPITPLPRGQRPPPPPVPTMALLEVGLKGGFSLKVDETDAGTTLALVTPSGATLEIDTAGVVKITAPQKAMILAPDVELGADGGKTLAFFSELNALVASHNSHTHVGVASGPSTSGPPSAPAATPVGTINTHAV